jgi:hypothetical protein
MPVDLTCRVAVGALADRFLVRANIDASALAKSILLNGEKTLK